jgi:hypothetical protein
MPVVISPDSDYGRELARWNTPKNKAVLDSSGDPVRQLDGTILMGMGGLGNEQHPKMLFKARNNPQSGKASVGEVMPHPADYSNAAEFERASLWVESFNKSCQKIVNSEQEERVAVGQGWHPLQTGALDLFEEQQKEFARIAAEEAWKAQRMTEKARAEFEEASNQTHEHVMDVAPKRKRGRPAKGVKGVTATNG